MADAVKKVLKSKEGEGGVRVQGGKGRCDPGQFELIYSDRKVIRGWEIGR